MLNLDNFIITIDEDGNVWAESDEEDWGVSNFVWDDESGQLIFIDIPQKTFRFGADGLWHKVGK